MAKVNKWLAQQQIKAEVKANARAEMHRRFAIQQMFDFAAITLNLRFGFGKKRCVEFLEAFKEIFTEYADICNEDAKGDDEIIYTQAQVDKALVAAVGEENFVPFEERYAWCYRIEQGQLYDGKSNGR